MKVLYVSGMYPTPTYPQKGIFCHEQVKALKQIGVEVDVVVPMTIYDKEYTCATWDYEGVSIRYIRFFKIPGVTGYEYSGKMLYNALMHSKIDFGSYDVFHADSPLPAGDALRRLSKKYNIPFVVHGHGLDVFFENSYQANPNCQKISNVCQKVYAQADAVAGVSQKVLNEIQKKVDISKKGYVVYNGVDTDKFYPVSREKSDKITITSIGNLIPLKGHDYTLKAVKQLVDAGYTNIRFKLAGRGELEEQLKELAVTLGIQKYVEFLGYVSYEEIVKLLQQTDIFVLPSWYEALGCVYLEAMACGVPAIGCKGNGIDEIITDGIDGLLVAPHNAQELAELLKDIISNRTWICMGEKARQTVENNYQWLHSALHLKKIYMEAFYDTFSNE